jgi:hypothetical protein
LQSILRSWKIESVQLKEEILYVIHDKMDHSKTTIPRFEVKNKIMIGLGQLQVTLMGMIVHGHEDEAYAQYSSEL